MMGDIAITSDHGIGTRVAFTVILEHSEEEKALVSCHHQQEGPTPDLCPLKDPCC